MPTNAYPTYTKSNALINSSYHVSVTIDDYPSTEIPILVGTGKSIPVVFTQQNALVPVLNDFSRQGKARCFASFDPRERKPNFGLKPPGSPRYLLPPPPPCLPVLSADFRSYGRGKFDPPPSPYRNYQPSFNFESKTQTNGSTRYWGQSVLKIEEVE